MLSEKACLFGIMKVRGIGTLTFGKLRKQIGTCQEIWHAPTDQLTGAIGANLAMALHKLREEMDPEAEMKKCQASGIGIIADFEPEYPLGLGIIHTPPPILFYRGHLEILKSPAIAIVGSRKATPYGRAVARRLGKDLTQAGLVVVSGMARGIDSEAHWGCLGAGGQTVGVLGNGVDVVYPRENRLLYDEVEKSGLLLSEFQPGTQPEPGHFPIRNRIISALSIGLVVVEALTKSGAMITVSYALEQGKDVFAVPGPITSPNSHGPHQLIQEGAKLVNSVEDILVELGIGIPSRNDPVEEKNHDRSRQVLELVGYEPVHLDKILQAATLSSGEVAIQLLELEIEGKIKCLPGNTYVRV